MKKIIFSTLLLLTLLGKAQNVSEIPTKNGLISYVFEHELQNQVKCLASYLYAYDQMDIFRKVNNKTLELSSDKKGILPKNYNITFNPGYLMPPWACSDTTTNGVLFIVLPPKIPFLFVDGKGNIISHSISAKVEIVFLNKTEYILKIKSFSYTSMSMKNKKLITEETPVSEIYEKYQKEEKKSKEQIKWFNAIHTVMLELDRVFLEAITEVSNADE